MKVFIGLLAALVALNGVLALPAGTPNDDAEVISVPRRKSISDDSDEDGFTSFKGVIDTGSGYPFLQPHPPPFNFGFFDSFDDLFRRLRTNFWPVTRDSDSDSNESGSSGVFGGLGGLGGFGVDGKKANTTSTVKVVDGHKVEVNETVYGDSGETFRVRIVNIRPLESGEEVEETVKTSVDEAAKPREPATSAPKVNNREDVDDSDERREPLERDNEIRGNADEQKTNEEKTAVEESDSTLLPSTIVEATTTTTTTAEAATSVPNSSEDNSHDNLNAAFVSDNSSGEQNLSGSGNIEAETNKPTDEIDKEGENENLRKMLKNYDDETAAAAPTTFNDGDEEAQTNATTDSVAEAAEDVNYSVDDDAAAAQDASLTIENNEKTETNDNFNESSEDADDVGDGDAATAVEMTKDLSEGADERESTSSTLDELNAEVLVAPGPSTIETFDYVEGADADAAADHAARARYASLKKEREHFASSSSSLDDEEAAEPVQMNPTFNSEWEHLAEELAQTNDQNNDLSNDIDIYGSVPVDLSNDIAVNYIAAAQADFPVNPDAELVDVDGALAGSSTLPQFEKLSVSTGYQPEPLLAMLAPAK